MSKCMVVVLAIGALVLATTAFAAPVTLTSGQMDKVSAGSGILDWFLGDATPVETNTSSEEEENFNLEAEVGIPVAVGDGAIAVNGEENITAGAVADNEAIAINGEDNVAVDVDLHLDLSGNIALGGSAAGENNRVLNLNDLEEGAAFIGDNNHVVVDNSEVDGEIYDESYGVVAREANVTNSFNVEEVEIDVEVDIEDSFNVSSNCLDISGQEGLQSIVNAASIGFQMIGTNLNVTSATATMPTSQNEDSANVPIIAGNALALTVLDQTVINGSLIVVVDIDEGLDAVAGAL